MECFMQFFHFKEIPRASYIKFNFGIVLRANNNPHFALPSLDQTQLTRSTLQLLHHDRGWWTFRLWCVRLRQYDTHTHTPPSLPVRS